MLKIIDLLKKNKINRIVDKKGSSMHMHKRYIPLIKEWSISLFTFNKNSIRFLPAMHDYLFKVLKWYFNMVNKKIKTKMDYNYTTTIKRSLGSKVWVSMPEIKCINEKLSITIYIYNRLYNQYKKELDTLEFIWSPSIKYFTEDSKIKVQRAKSITFAKHNSTTHFNTSTTIIDNNRSYYVKTIRLLKYIKFMKFKGYKSDMFKLKDKKINLLNLMDIKRYNYLINLFKKELLYIKLKQKMLFNEFKFTELYLTPLIYLLEIIYKKKIEFNIIMLKNFFLSSDILSQMIVAKVISSKNRGRPLKPVNDSIEAADISDLTENKMQRIDKVPIGMQNVLLNRFVPKKEHDLLNEFLLTKKSKIWSSRYIDDMVLKNLENKSVAGIYIRTTGRLTKRFKSQRAVNHLRSRGTLKNVYSSHQAFSSVLSRGYANINIEKTIQNSKVRIGAFGITGWVASY